MKLLQKGRVDFLHVSLEEVFVLSLLETVHRLHFAWHHDPLGYELKASIRDLIGSGKVMPETELYPREDVSIYRVDTHNMRRNDDRISKKCSIRSMREAMGIVLNFMEEDSFKIEGMGINIYHSMNKGWSLARKSTSLEKYDLGIYRIVWSRRAGYGRKDFYGWKLTWRSGMSRQYLSYGDLVVV